MAYIAIILLVVIFLSMSDFVQGMAHGTAELSVVKSFS